MLDRLGLGQLGERGAPVIEVVNSSPGGSPCAEQSDDCEDQGSSVIDAAAAESVCITTQLLVAQPHVPFRCDREILTRGKAR